MIEEIKGDVFKAKEDIIIHGCNCYCTWGAGVAKTMLKLYPHAFEKDSLTNRGDKNKLGDFSYWQGKHYYYDQNITVVNLYSQYKYGHTEIYADYDAIKEVLETVEYVFRGYSIAMPKIGAGLAGGDWATIKKIIEDVFNKNELVRIYSISD